MASNLPFWGAPTSNANFCEEDYAVTRYIAEFINTLTNLVYIFYAIYGLRNLQQKSNNTLRSLPYWGLMGVGICSSAFHITLKYHTQMLDDLSMLLTTTPVLHRVLTVNACPRDAVVVTILLGSFLTAVVAVHVLTDELILHALAFAAMVTTIGVRTMQLIHNRMPAHWDSRGKVLGMVRFGAFIFNLGYALWLVDNWACGFLRSWKGAIGHHWGFLLELHGWWHICTGIGAYIFIAVVDYITSDDIQRDVKETFAWPAPWASQSFFAGSGTKATRFQD